MIYKKEVHLKPIDGITLPQLIEVIGQPILETNRENNWEDDNFEDIKYRLTNGFMFDDIDDQTIDNAIREFIHKNGY